MDDALRFLKRAVELDPEFASAHALTALCQALRRANGWMIDPGNEITEAVRFAQRAADLGRDDALSLAAAGAVVAYLGRDLDAGVALTERAITLNPNLAFGWFWSGYVRLWFGEPDEAIERVARAMRLSPLDPYIPAMHAAIADAHFHAGRYEEASSWAAKSVRGAPRHNALRIAAASNALAGRLDLAREAMGRLREIDPDLRISNLRNVQGPYRRPEDHARYEEGMRKAGLPE